MPPKPRGGGSTRARGAARDGATAGREAVATSEATEDATAPATATEAPAESVTPKQEDGEPKPIATEDEASVTASAVASPQPGAESTTRAPVQRLGSLQGSVPPSRSASPSVRGRGSATRGKARAKVPTFTGRRSKEERDAIAKEQAARDKERTKEQVAAEARRERDRVNKERREANKIRHARGGYSGVASGPFSLGSSKEDRKNNPNRGYSGFGSGSGSRAERVKNEDGIYGGSGHRSGGDGGGGGSSIKREAGGMISSDEEEEDVNVPRRDIDLIEISSDEDESKPKNVPAPRARAAALPVRIGRKEHQERTFGINTEASSETSAKLLEQAESTGQSLQAVSEQTNRKGKSKSKDMEITGSRKQFKGVWHDSEDSDVAIKTEPTSDDENSADAEQSRLPDGPAQPAETEEPHSPDAGRKPKAKIKGIAEPVLQTDEDRAEWARFQANLRHIRAELGPEPPEELPQVDGSGDVAMTDATAITEKKPTVRDNNVYLFQIPPLMPELNPPTIKNEAPDPLPPPKPAQPASKPGDPKIKLEEGGFSDPSAKTSDGPRFGSGLVGKLRVHESGRTTLDWGGTSYELTPGNKASFLQEVASLQITPPGERVAPEAGGDAVSFGRVKGKFVVVPNWGDMLG